MYISYVVNNGSSVANNSSKYTFDVSLRVEVNVQVICH